MRIYFTASVSTDKSFVTKYKRIVEILKKEGHEVFSSYVAEKKIGSKRVPVSSQKIFEQEKKRIEKADVVVAEVSAPSLGVGFLISHALSRETCVLALFYKDAQNLLSPMIEGNPSEFLYLEHYEDDNLQEKIKKFLEHIAQNNKRTGKFVVIEGADGSGKKTQADFLISYLKKHKYNPRYIDFPRYYSSFHGRIVGQFLRGDFGDINEVSPYLASLAYALDRLTVKDDLDRWLAHGDIVVANRYVTSNMAHQSVKLPGGQQEKFLDWIDELEYRIHKLPREDIVIYLYVPYEIGERLVRKKGYRGYLKGKRRDIHERNASYMKQVEKMYLRLAKLKKHWVKISCVKDGKMQKRRVIHQEIIEILRKRRIIL